MAGGRVGASLVRTTYKDGLMNKRYEALISLYPPDQLRQMERIRDALLDDPTSLDNRHEPVEAGNGNEEGSEENC